MIRTWCLLSDLHLGLGEDPRHTGLHLTRFIDAVVRPHSEDMALVLLGDTFDLGCAEGDSSAKRLEAIANHHPEVFSSLAGCLRAGARLHFVAGNHDYDLARPAATARLRQLLAPRDNSGVQVHPWALHVPGLMFAEHGHQHHLVHRLPTMLLAAQDDHVSLDSSMLTAWTSAGASGVERVRDLTTATFAARRAETRARGKPYRHLLELQADALHLDAAAVRDLWEVTRFRPAAALSGAAGRGLRRVTGLQANPRPPKAAARVAHSLRDHGKPVRWYVTGHTHRALAAPIVNSEVGYFNTGTWTSDVRGPGPDQCDRTLYPTVTMTKNLHEWRAELRYWRAES